MLRELLDRLCRRGPFTPITYGGGLRDREGLPAARRDAAIRDRLERSDYVYTPSALDLSGVETTFDPDDRRPWKPGEPRAQLAPPPGVAGETALDAPRGGYPEPMPRMRVDDDPPWPHNGIVWVQPGVEEAHAIVRMLALVEPSCAVDDPARVCHICDAWGADAEHFTHEPTCAYRRAVEWVKANPA